MDNFLSGVLATLGALGLIAIVVLYVAANWESIEKFLSVFPRIVAKFSHSAQLMSTSLSIQSDINLAISNLESEVPALFSHGVKVEWVTEGEDFAKSDEDAIVIRVRDIQDHTRAYVNSVIQLLKRCLMPDAQRFLHGHVLQSIELVLADRFFETTRFRDARNLYYSEYYDPVIEKNKSVAQVVENLHTIDERGIFTRVFLRECQVLPITYGAHYKPSGIKFELNDFVSYLSTFIESLEDPDKPAIEFLFCKQHFRLGFAVLADYEKILQQGTYFYQARTRRSIEGGARTIYILAMGKRHITHAYKLANWLEAQRLVRSVIPMSYKQYAWSGEIQSLCILCDVRPDLALPVVESERSPTQLSETDVVNALSAEIDGISTGEIQIVKIGIVKGRIQVAINSTRIEPKYAVAKCIGPNGLHSKKLQQALNEPIRFVPWSSDLKEFIVSNLDQFDSTKLIGVEIDPSQKTALVVVPSEDLAIQARGPWDLGLQCGSLMTEYEIQVIVDPNVRLSDIITRTVPEIQTGAMRIEKTAIVEGIQAKIQVSSTSVLRPALLCGGYWKAIQERQKTHERIYFCELIEGDPEGTLISALFPLRRESIIAVELDPSQNSATVLVSSERDQRVAVGPEGANVKTAARIMGLRRIQVNLGQP